MEEIINTAEYTIIPNSLTSCIQYFNAEIYNLNDLPKSINISTISISGHFNTIIHLENVSKYINLSPNDIISVKYSKKIRSIENIKYKKPVNLRCFINQLTLILKIKNNKKINIKLFKNGAFQMTGCKATSDCSEAIYKLIYNISGKILITENNLIIEKYFIENFTESISVIDVNIDMINSNFKLNYKLNRNVFYELLKQENINCRYEPCIHASINIKYYINTKMISIFVFQSGNIIITGAKSKIDIINTYNYINDLLTRHFNKIIKRNLMTIFTDNDINEMLDEL